jgi:hypothetical protein
VCWLGRVLVAHCCLHDFLQQVPDGCFLWLPYIPGLLGGLFPSLLVRVVLVYLLLYWLPNWSVLCCLVYCLPRLCGRGVSAPVCVVVVSIGSVISRVASLLMCVKCLLLFWRVLSVCVGALCLCSMFALCLYFS